MFVLCSAKQVVSVIRYGNRDAGLIDDDENVCREGQAGCVEGCMESRKGSHSVHYSPRDATLGGLS